MGEASCGSDSGDYQRAPPTAKWYSKFFSQANLGPAFPFWAHWGKSKVLRHGIIKFLQCLSFNIFNCKLFSPFRLSVVVSCFRRPPGSSGSEGLILQLDGFLQWLCPPADPLVATITCTNNLVATALGGHIHNGGPKCGKFRIYVSNFPWKVRKMLLAVLVDDLPDRGLHHMFPVHWAYQVCSVVFTTRWGSVDSSFPLFQDIWRQVWWYNCKVYHWWWPGRLVPSTLMNHRSFEHGVFMNNPWWVEMTKHHLGSCQEGYSYQSCLSRSFSHCPHGHWSPTDACWWASHQAWFKGGARFLCSKRGDFRSLVPLHQGLWIPFSLIPSVRPIPPGTPYQGPTSLTSQLSGSWGCSNPTLRWWL